MPAQFHARALSSMDATHAFAKQLASLLYKGDVVFLEGDLGAGKTTFAQFLIQALSPEIVDVTSPTFTLLQTYPIVYANGEVGEIYHYDLYRIEHPSALAELGLEEAAEHLMLIEWPQRLENYPLSPTLELSFAIDAEGSHAIIIRQAREGLTLQLLANSTPIISDTPNIK